MTSKKRTGGGFKAAIVLFVFFALLAVVVFADAIETRIQLLPTPERPAFARPLAVAILIALGIVVLVRFARSRRASGRTLRVRDAHDGVAATATRTRAFVQAFEGLYPEVSVRRLGYRFTLLADGEGIAFWSGAGRRPARVLLVSWDDVRSVRSDTVSVGEASRPALIVRIRHAGASLELPVLLTPGRREQSVGGEELGKRGEASFAIVRLVKAAHRKHLLRGGMTFEQAMDIAPITSPIDVATARAELDRLHAEQAKAAAQPAAMLDAPITVVRAEPVRRTPISA
ncbi:hypothetical protein [Agromyces seonyuensis]|uniref:Uncharacterized protein n=1 Tax=Agromyces seonyuensis TaxID=2662446 RepID=A0A6I4P8B5_9MICO|nr:hypothetical protein [Agromyces seonyuensis]MWC00265.1 hypothetical protein [Agromyces seonyuensis]